MVVTRGDDFASLYKHGTQCEAHGALRSSLRALRKIKLSLVHCMHGKVISDTPPSKMNVAISDERKKEGNSAQPDSACF